MLFRQLTKYRNRWQQKSGQMIQQCHTSYLIHSSDICHLLCSAHVGVTRNTSTSPASGLEDWTLSGLQSHKLWRVYCQHVKSVRALDSGDNLMVNLVTSIFLNTSVSSSGWLSFQADAIQVMLWVCFTTPLLYCSEFWFVKSVKSAEHLSEMWVWTHGLPVNMPSKSAIHVKSGYLNVG